MSEQMSFVDLNISMDDEESVFQAIKPAFTSVMERNGIPESYMNLSKKKEYFSVELERKPELAQFALDKTTYLICRIKCGKKLSYISIKNLPESQSGILENYETSQTKTDSDSGFIRIHISGLSAQDLAPVMSLVMANTIESIPKEFDCCSRYEECSNARRCTHPDPNFAMGCGYRSKLSKGIIYYGENKTVS